MAEQEENRTPAKKPWYRRWWGITLIAIIALGVISSLANQSERPNSKPAVQQAEDHKPVSQDTSPQPVPPPTQTPQSKAISLDEIYEKVQLGMTEQQVRDIAGEPAMTSEADMQGFGKVINLVYTAGYGRPDNITVSVQNGVVKVVALGKWENGKLNTKTKM